MAKWIEFYPVDMPGRKTKVFLVFNKENFEVPIGEIKWYGAFRKYAFFPQPNTVYETTCLKDITEFLDNLMVLWKAQKEQEKTNKLANMQAGGAPLKEVVKVLLDKDEEE